MSAKADEVREWLSSVAELVSQFSDSAQPIVLKMLWQERFERDLEAGVAVGDKKAQRKTTSRRSSSKSASQKKTEKQTVALNKNLVLSGSGKSPSFQDFIKEKKPATNIEFNAVALYYLLEVMEMKAVTSDDVYTCYREASRKPPSTDAAFFQSLRDAAGNSYGYIDAADFKGLRLSMRGRHFVEQGLPKAAA